MEPPVGADPTLPRYKGEVRAGEGGVERLQGLEPCPPAWKAGPLSQLSFKRKRGRAAVTPPPGREALDDDRDSNPDLPLSLPTRIRTWGLLLPKQTG